MTCREFAEFLADYLSGALSPETTAQFERHLSQCPNCLTYLSNYRATIGLARQAFANEDADLPDDVPGELVQAILVAGRRR
jgi:anti-sigma factor RsiW